MKKKTSRTDSAPVRHRKHRPRPTPKWLKEQRDLDEVARRRCLMILSVISGEKPVTDAITEAKISRQMYYQLEERALNAMLRALSPGASSEETASAGAVARARELELKMERLEQERRRSDRLLLLTRKMVGRGTLKVAPGRPKGTRTGTSATRVSKKPSKISNGSPKDSTLKASEPLSNPGKDGGAER